MIARDVCERVLQRAASTGADYAEIFAEYTVDNGIRMITGKVDAVDDTVIAGAGIRVFKGLRSVMASTVDTSEAGLMRCAERAAEALGQGDAAMTIRLRERLFGDVHPVRVAPVSVPNDEKVSVLREADAAARNYDACIKRTSCSLISVDHSILIATSEGLYTQDRQIRTRLVMTAVAEKNGETQTGSANPGYRMGMEMFEGLVDPTAVGIEAARQAAVMAGAGYCPAGVMPVAIGNGFGGVIFHEACGHSLEATSVEPGMSEFAGKLGQQIAAPCVTAIDDGTLPGEWGSENIDDEGLPTTRLVLIENGVLKNYMIDRLNGLKMGMAPTGSGRRESYAYAPTSRMRNTFIAAGQDDEDEMIRTMGDGLYAAQMGGGSVNPATGEFNFAVQEGYLVKDGKIVSPVRGASLIGRGSEILMRIDRVGREMTMGQGMCGSRSGSVPTNVGQPTIRVSRLTVGGK